MITEKQIARNTKFTEYHQTRRDQKGAGKGDRDQEASPSPREEFRNLQKQVRREERGAREAQRRRETESAKDVEVSVSSACANSTIESQAETPDKEQSVE